jgi:hypothetical protein
LHIADQLGLKNKLSLVLVANIDYPSGLTNYFENKEDC